MHLAPHQRELLRLNPDLDPRDIPADWRGGADLDEQLSRNKDKREAREAATVNAPKATPAAPTAKAKRPVTQKDLIALIDVMTSAMVTYVGEKLDERPAFDYTGVHELGRSYKRGQGCTHGGSIWIAMRDHPDAPGGVNGGWVLAVKRGRDAR